MDIDLSAQVSTFERSKPKFAWDIDRVPKGKVTRATIVQGPSVGIIQAAKHRDLTWDWVSWLTGKEIQAYEATVAHMAMARKSADVAFLKLPPPPQHRAEIIDSVPFARQLEYVQNFIQIDDVTNKHLDDVLVSNSKTAQAAMQAACQQITPLLGKG